jgi:acylphosphatase
MNCAGAAIAIAGDRAMSGAPSRQRRTVHYSGHVQGVGFRFTAERIAGRFDVAGFVKNLPDGRVLVVVEGEPRELDRFLAAIQSQMSGNIRTVAVAPSEAKGEFAEFGVQY